MTLHSASVSRSAHSFARIPPLPNPCIPNIHRHFDCTSSALFPLQGSPVRSLVLPSTHFRYCSCEHRYFWQLAVFPPPVSVSIACRLLLLSQSASGWNAFATLSLTHSVCVPELSESRYLCTSMINPVVELSGFLTSESAAALPELTNDSADVKPLPGRRIMLEAAPAPRIAVTTSCTVAAQVLISGISCGSFMTPKAILELEPYLVASCFHTSASCALVGPPWPTILPCHRA